MVFDLQRIQSTPPKGSNEQTRSLQLIANSCKNKVTIRPGFPGTVPIFNLKSRKNSQFSRDAHLSRFWPGVPDLSRLDKLLRLPEFNSSCLVTIVHTHGLRWSLHLQQSNA